MALPPATWNFDGRDGYRDAQLTGLRAYEDAVCRRILALLGLAPLAKQIAYEVGEVTGVPACSFAAMDTHLHFPVKFGVGKINGVKFLALPDLFDRWTSTALHKNLVELSTHRGDDVPLALVFRYNGDTANPGPRGGRFMTLHTFDSTPILDRTRISRPGKLGRRKVTFTLEVLDALMASFAGWSDSFKG